jgi:hypothetical protein
MTNTVLETMNARYNSLMKLINTLEKLKKSFPEGRLKVQNKKSGTYITLYSKGELKTLSEKDAELIKLLVQKSYVLQAIKTAKTETVALKQYISKYPDASVEQVYDNLSAGRKKYATPLILSNEDYVKQWLNEPFIPKSISKDAPRFFTLKGEHVRSKSEVIIADRLYAKGIPYKYECPVIIGGTVFHPDFTILRLSDRKILYHEHCGKMGDEGYVNDFLDRVNKFGRVGVFTGDRLFFTFESSDHPFDISWLDDFIERNYR